MSDSTIRDSGKQRTLFTAIEMIKKISQKLDWPDSFFIRVSDHVLRRIDVSELHRDDRRIRQKRIRRFRICDRKSFEQKLHPIF